MEVGGRNEYSCMHCKRTFTRKDNCDRHVASCPSAKLVAVDKLSLLEKTYEAGLRPYMEQSACLLSRLFQEHQIMAKEQERISKEQSDSKQLLEKLAKSHEKVAKRLMDMEMKLVSVIHEMRQERHSLIDEILNKIGNMQVAPSVGNATGCVAGMTKQGDHGTVNNTQNNNVNININNLRDYGKEDMSHITHEDKMTWAADPQTGVLSYVHKKHFDPTKPENHNLRMASAKREELNVFQDGQWQRMSARPFMGKVLEKAVDDLSAGIDWNNIAPEAEKYFSDVSDSLECKQAKDSIRDLVCLVTQQKLNASK